MAGQVVVDGRRQTDDRDVESDTGAAGCGARRGLHRPPPIISRPSIRCAPTWRSGRSRPRWARIGWSMSAPLGGTQPLTLIHPISWRSPSRSPRKPLLTARSRGSRPSAPPPGPRCSCPARGRRRAPRPAGTAGARRLWPRGGLLHRHQNAERVAEAAAAQPHRPVESCALIRSPTARVWPMNSSSGELDLDGARGCRQAARSTGASESSRPTAACLSSVPRYRSKALGAPPRWMWPRIVTRASSPSPPRATA